MPIKVVPAQFMLSLPTDARLKKVYAIKTGKLRLSITYDRGTLTSCQSAFFLYYEEQVLMIAKSMFKTLGFAVIEAVNGKDALDLYQNKSSEITLVLTDIGMPIMDGYELIRELKKLNPELPIIISSGFGDIDISSKISRKDVAGLISKPYNFNQMREVVNSVIDGDRN